MSLGKRPRIPFKQPKAFCRSFVFHWGGLMLAQPRTSESQILSSLPSKATGTITHSSKLEYWDDLHGSDATKAYEFDKRWTPGTKFGTGL